ncbi:hypothetical protein IH992_08915, partial [Candidatus Poribacteria bacterium]|nr:hypothetical protein [Candidatus Poribacteria bacterium]
MSQMPTLYVGIAAPLVEAAYEWIAEIPLCDDQKARREKLKAFPHRQIGAYGLSFQNPSALVFRTNMRISRERVEAEVEAWSGKPPELLPDPIFDPVPPLDHRKALSELKQALSGQPLHIVSRIGLTSQQLQRDLAALRPELVILDCHGTKQGNLLFEDGRGRADVVPGERLFPMLHPRPTVLFLAACYSEVVLQRTEDAADWKDAAIVHVSGETPIEVTACVAFQSMFFPGLLRGETAGEAFDAACRYVANDPNIGGFSVGPGEVSPDKKFRINDGGREVVLTVSPNPSGADTFTNL